MQVPRKYSWTAILRPPLPVRRCTSESLPLLRSALPLNQLKPFIHRQGLIAVMITHSHTDHIQYLHEYVEAYPNLVAIIFKGAEKKIKCNYIKPIKDEEIITVGQLSKLPATTQMAIIKD